MSLPKKVELIEVGPRDGLQNEARNVPTSVKIEFIERLVDAGFKRIEVTSFVSAERIPQLADAKQVSQGIQKKPSVRYCVLVPNRQGLQGAINAGMQEIAVFTAASETFTQRNINCSIKESLLRFEHVIEQAKQHNMSIRAYISCCLACPYEGDIKPSVVTPLAKQLFDMGCDEVCLGDTIGKGSAGQVQALLSHILKVIPLKQLAMHFHDTYGQALANIYTALTYGVSIFDCSVSGLGGCPYAPGASGNVASEDVVYLLQRSNIECGIDLNKLIAAGRFITQYLERPTQSKVSQALKHQKL